MQLHGERVLSLLGRILGDDEDARDASQETWTKVWRARERLQLETDPWPYIRQTAVNQALDQLRARRAGPGRAGVDVEALPTKGASAEGPDLGALPAMERVCLTLFFWEGCSVNDIAGQLQVPPGTVKSWMFRARAQLRRQLEEKP